MPIIYGVATPTPVPPPTPVPVPPPPPPPPAPALVTAGNYLFTDSEYQRLYGPGKFVVDFIGNLRVGDVTSVSRIVSHRFRATESSNVVGVKANWPAGSGYAAGNGGTIRVRIMPNDGTANNFPDLSGTALSTGTLVLGMSGGAHSTNNQFTAVTLTPTSPLVSGTLYHVVYDNIAADPATNYFSVNNDLTVINNGRPNRWNAISEWASLYGTRAVGSGGAFSWTDFNANPNGSNHYVPMCQIALSSGSKIGLVVIEGGNVDDVGYIWTVGNASPVRERFTPSTAKTVIGFSVQTCAKVAGDLLVELKQGGTVLDSKTITQSPANHSNASSAAVLTWYDRLFDAPINLTASTVYDLTFTPQGSSTWSFPDMRNGEEQGFAWQAAFTESQAEHFQAGAFRPAYHWDHTAAAWGGGSNWRVVLHLA